MKILFVCTGNICRSPMAQVIFANICEKHGRKDLVIKGAGTGARDGENMTADAYRALKSCGEKIPPQPLSSTRWDDDMLNEFDHIVCMARNHARIIDLDGEHAHVYTLDSVTGGGDVFDPWAYPLEVYKDVCKRLQADLEILYNEIVTGG